MAHVYFCMASFCSALNLSHVRAFGPLFCHFCPFCHPTNLPCLSPRASQPILRNGGNNNIIYISYTFDPFLQFWQPNFLARASDKNITTTWISIHITRIENHIWSIFEWRLPWLCSAEFWFSFLPPKSLQLPTDPYNTVQYSLTLPLPKKERLLLHR